VKFECISDDCKFVLESDGSEFDEDAFDDVVSETLLFLKPTEKWRPRESTNEHGTAQQVNVKVIDNAVKFLNHMKDRNAL